MDQAASPPRRLAEVAVPPLGWERPPSHSTAHRVPLQELLCATGHAACGHCSVPAEHGARLVRPGSPAVLCVTWGGSLPLAADRGLLPWKVGVITTATPLGAYRGARNSCSVKVCHGLGV